MARVDDVKSAIEDAVPGRAPRRRRLPVALLMAALAGAVALLSRLEPVRDAARSAIASVRGRVSTISRGGEPTTPSAAEGSPAAIAAGSGATASDTAASGTAASDLAAGTAASDMAADTAADAPVGIGFDDAAGSAASSGTIPADTEEGRPAGV